MKCCNLSPHSNTRSSDHAYRQDALFVALGPTPLAALDHCAGRGLLHPRQVLGAFAYPSAGGGCQVPVYLGDKMPEELAAGDPMRHRLGFLLPAAERMRTAVEARLSGQTGFTRPAPSRLRPEPATAGAKPAPWPTRQSPSPANTNGIHFVVTRGKNAGAVLRPHIHADGHLVVSPIRFEKEYVRLPAGTDVEPYLTGGYSLRMSAPSCALSLIAPASIRGRNRR